MLECKQSQIKQFFLIQGQITPDVTVRFDPYSNSSKISVSYILQPCLVPIGLHLQIQECKQSYSAIFANSRANNSDSSGLIKSIIKLIRDLMFTCTLTKFSTDWLIFVDARCKQSQMQNFLKFKGK